MSLAPVGLAHWNPLNPVANIQRAPDSVLLTLKSGVMKLEVLSDSIIRVRYSPADTIPEQHEYVAKQDWTPVRWDLDANKDVIELSTRKMRVQVARKNSSISFLDSKGKRVFEQTEITKRPVVVNGDKSYHAELHSKLWASYEAFYGLGQHQAGVWNYRGEAVDLSQDNTNISIPFFLSSNGYGIFWNNTSRGRFNNRFPSALYLSSEVADIADYYFIYGPEFDQVIAGYRQLTGAPPLFGKWA